MEENKNAVNTTAKERSKTDAFKEHVQKIIYQSLGVKVSKDKAWDLFKGIMHGTVEFTLNLKETVDADGNKSGKKLPLSGVGTFQILETKPRGSKAGLDEAGNPIEGAEVWPCVPRFRFYPSSTIDTLCEYKYGLGNHEVDEKHYGIFATEAPVEAVAEAVEETEAVDEVATTDAADDGIDFEDEI